MEAHISHLAEGVYGIRIFPEGNHWGDPFVASCWVRREGDKWLVEGFVKLPDVSMLASARAIRKALVGEGVKGVVWERREGARNGDHHVHFKKENK